MKQTGNLVVSLDFELLWGVFDKVQWNAKVDYFNNTREVIPKILKSFEEYEVSCTWATVGMLFNENWDEWNTNIPDNIPNYINKSLSAYKYGKSIQSKETENLCFAPNLIKLIKNTKGQELGTHTYSHYYCLEPGQNAISFRDDLEKASDLASKFGDELRSLVFPRNQYNQEYLKICRENGIDVVRTNPDNWYWQNTQKDSLTQKIFRTGDAYLGFLDKSYHNQDIQKIISGISGQKASRLLRPYSGKQSLDRLRLKRILSEMTDAAKNNKIYHIWWHPHNFGSNPNRNLQELEIILKNYKILKLKYGFRSKSMSDLNSN